MTLRLNGATSGYTEIDAPAVAGSNTLTLPGGNGSADQALVTNGSGTLSFADRGRMVLDTAKASTSGTSVDFTGIPSWAKRVTVMFSGVSTNGASSYQIQLGDSGGFETTGYTGSCSFGGGGATTFNSSGYIVNNNIGAAATHSGIFVITTLGSNAWAGSGVIAPTVSNGSTYAGGSKTLSDTLTQIRITTVNGTDTFDAGSINILYEG